MYWASPLSASVSDNHHDLLQSSPSEWDFQRFLSEASVSDNHHDLLQPSSPSPAASSSVVPLLFSQEMVQQKLQALMESAKESWIYAIFWQSSVDVAGPTLLGWGDGYYKGEDDSRRRPKASAAENEHRKRVLKELNSLISGASASDDASDEDVTDTEWFFLVSMTQSFVNGSGLPGQSFFSTFPIWLSGADQLNASPCDRARQAQIFGIQTMVCIPFGYGVVEVGSTNHIINDSDLLNKARILFNFGDGGWPYLAKNDPLVHCIEEPSSATRVETKEHLAFRETKNFFVEMKSTTDLQQRKRVVVRRKLKEKRKLVEELPSTGTDTRFQGKEVEVKNEKLEERKILQEESPPASELEGREKLDEFPPTQEFEKGKKMEEEFPPTSGFEERIIKRIPGLEKGKRFEENKKQEPDTSHEDEDCSIPPKILQWEKKVEIPLLTYTTNQVDTRIMISDFEKSIENDVQNRMEKTLREERLITIPKIPAGIRQGMNEYYEPRIISIGPYHRDKPELRYMEKRKWLYLDALLSRNKNRSLKDYVDITVEFEDRVRSCYQRNDEFQSEDFVKMMLVDGCFIVEYLMQLDSDNLDQVKLCEMVWMQSVVHNDMLLLENQLPFYLLLCIFELTTENRYPISFINLAHKFFRRVSPTDLTGVPPLISPSQVHHLLHLYHMSLFPTPIDVNDCNPPANLLARVKSRCMNLISCRPSTLKENPSLAETSPNLKALETGPFLTKMIPSARALEEAGIKFKKKDGGSILDAKFHKGVLEIPPLLVDAFTMSRFRNLIALEKLFPLTFKEPLFTAYVQFLDYLINTYKDIQLLQKEGIITHALGSDEEVARLFNGLTSGTFDYQPDHLKKMYDEVEKYCKAKKHIWRAILMRDYFSNPWAAFSVGAAVILLIFTFLQTFFSMYGYFRPPSGSS